jgi:hypothetical protein
MRTLQGLDQAPATAEPAPVLGPLSFEPHLPLASVMAGRHASEYDRASPAAHWCTDAAAGCGSGLGGMWRSSPNGLHQR